MLDSLDTSIFAQFDVFVRLTTVDIVILTLCALGVAFLAYWLFGYAGPVSLAAAPLRRNRLPAYLPLVYITVWLICVAGAATIISRTSAESPRWVYEFYSFFAVAVIELALIVSFLYVARHGFSRRLKGFGLNVCTIGADLRAAVINFISALPLVLFGIWLVAYLGRQIVGPDFQMQRNEGLTVIVENPQVALRVLMLIFTIVVVPVFEEMLFRGMLQSVIRTVVAGPWSAVLITSAAFVLLHPWMHLPALFILSVCMGYAYERSGSLFRPIFIHAFFNAASVTAALLS